MHKQNVILNRKGNKPCLPIGCEPGCSFSMHPLKMESREFSETVLIKSFYCHSEADVVCFENNFYVNLQYLYL